jgi:hypothetical protein
MPEGRWLGPKTLEETVLHATFGSDLPNSTRVEMPAHFTHPKRHPEMVSSNVRTAP